MVEGSSSSPPVAPQARVRRRRRPSAEPPPLPREASSVRWWLALAAVVVLGVVTELILRGGDDLNRVGDAVLEAFESIRTPVLTDIAEALAFLTAFGAVQALRLALAIALIVTKRFRHLVVALATFVISDWLVLSFLDVELEPAQVTPMIDASDFRFPS